MVVVQENSLSQEKKLSIKFSGDLYEDMCGFFFWRQSGNIDSSFKMKMVNLPKDFDQPEFYAWNFTSFLNPVP